MAKSIKLSKSSTLELPDISSYKLIVSAVQPEGMTSKIFVKQRTRNFARGLFEDTFVAVCTPTQLEDFAEDAPGEGSSYYRTESIELVMRTPELLLEVFESLKYEVKKLVIDLDALDNLSATQLYEVSAGGPVVAIPSAPTITSITGAVNALSIAFTPAASSGVPVKTYEYSLNGGLLWQSRGADSSLSPVVISGLPGSMTYNVKIRAVDFLGNKGLATQPTVYGYTVPYPAAPTINSVTAGDAGKLIVNFTSASGGTAPAATNYEYSSDGGSTWLARTPASVTSPITIEGLGDNIEYSIKIRGTANGVAGDMSNTVVGRTVSVAPPATFWTSCTATLGVSKLITNLGLSPLNFTKTKVGDAASGAPGNWIIEQNTTTPELTDVSFNITGNYAKTTLVVCYRNDYVDNANPGVGSYGINGAKYPYLGFALANNINVTGVGSFVRFKWNGVKLFEFLNQTNTSPINSYLPAANFNYGTLGGIAPGQTGNIVIEIEAQGAGTAAFSFFLGYD